MAYGLCLRGEREGELDAFGDVRDQWNIGDREVEVRILHCGLRPAGDLGLAHRRYLDVEGFTVRGLVNSQVAGDFEGDCLATGKWSAGQPSQRLWSEGGEHIGGVVGLED